MAHPYYGGRGYDPAYRPDYTVMPHDGYYDCPAPYVYGESYKEQKALQPLRKNAAATEIGLAS